MSLSTFFQHPILSTFDACFVAMSRLCSNSALQHDRLAGGFMCSDLVLCVGNSRSHTDNSEIPVVDFVTS